MEDAKRQMWMYLIAGVVAIAAGWYFILVSGGTNILDWAIIGGGVVAVFRGLKQAWQLRRDTQSSSD